jgi:hypothetical protein
LALRPSTRLLTLEPAVPVTCTPPKNTSP